MESSTEGETATWEVARWDTGLLSEPAGQVVPALERWAELIREVSS